MEMENNILYSVKDTDIINGKFTIPEKITIIGDGVFENRSDLEEIDTQNVEVIGVGAFHNCKNLKKVNATNVGIRIIDDAAFYNCENLKKVIMPNLEYINRYAFDNCISLPCPNDKVRKEIYEKTLEYLNKNELWGLCLSIDVAISDIIVKYKQAICRQTCFPLFTYQNAIEKFGAIKRSKYGWWWSIDNRETRKKFLTWCFENNINNG